jgi:hypothetical protein
MKHCAVFVALVGLAAAAAGCTTDEPAGQDEPSPPTYVVMKRPPGVPEDFVATPNGWFDPACVIEVKPGEREAADGSVLRRDGSVRRAASRCRSPRFDAQGHVVMDDGGAARRDARRDVPAVNGWVEFAESSALGAMSSVRASWTVPAAPPDTGQVIYLFPGLQDAPSTRILQPVLGFNQAHAARGSWTLESWNCCVAGTTTHSSAIPATPGTTVEGEILGKSCNPATGVCPGWSIVTRNAEGASVTLDTTVSTPMEWLVGHALEAYGIETCDELPPGGSSVASDFKLRDVRRFSRPAPAWGHHSRSTPPSCGWSVAHTSTTATLSWTSAPGGP